MQEYFVTLQVIIEADSAADAENAVENAVSALPNTVVVDDCTAVKPGFRRQRRRLDSLGRVRATLSRPAIPLVGRQRVVNPADS